MSHSCDLRRAGRLAGHEGDLTALAQTAVKDAEARGEGLALTVTERLSAALYNGLGRYDVALAGLGGAERDPEEGPALWALTELIEAAVRSEQPQRVAKRSRGSRTTRACGRDWGLAIAARCRALLSEGDDADGLHREAIERLGRTRVPVQLACTHLLYGEWLRRRRRRLDARAQLRTAYQMFTATGIDSFAARAGRELAVIGERARNGTVEPRDKLTPDSTGGPDRPPRPRRALERGDRSAALHQPAHGRVHLRKVFADLDIRSRNQLSRGLPVA